MKKFWSIFTVALVALSAVSCSNNFEEEVVLGGETLSFNVNIDNTRTALEQGENGWNTVWVGNETLVVSDGTNSYSFKNTDKNKNKFTCTADGVRSLIGKAVNVVYNNVINSAAGAAGMTLKGAADSFSESVAIELAADNAFLKLTSTADVTLAASTEIFGNGSAILKSVTVKAGTDVLVPIYAATEVTLSATFAGVPAKSATLTFVNNKIYNLGTLEAKKNEVFLVPGVWASDGARFAVYETATDTWTNMTPVTGEFGLYSAEVSSSKIIFARMNPSTSANNWNNKWNQTADLVVPTDDKNCYYITDWDKGEWRAYTPIKWAIAGTFLDPNWNIEVEMSEVSDSVYSLTNQTLKAHDEFKVKVFGDKDWKTSFGPISFSFFTPGHWQTAGLNASGNFSVDRAGTYDFYLDVANTRIYVVKAGSEYTAATEQKTEGQAPEQDADAPMLYLKPNSNWLQANARFAAYFFGNGERWVSMTDSDSDGIYEVAIPTDKKFPKIIFCRMNPSATANDWGNKWNQTGDLTIPTDGKNLYTINKGSWDAGSWSTK